MKEVVKLKGRDSSIYYGWVIVGLALISMAFWWGIRSSFSVFYVALLQDFTWSRGDTAGVQSVSLITYAILAPLVGGLIDRFGPRRVISYGILVLTSGLFLCATTKTLAAFYLFYGVIVASGITSIGIVSFSAILVHWFEKRRGLASGIAVSGIGLGTSILAPLSQHLIELIGWRFAFFTLGGLVLVVLLPLNAIFLRHKPSELGQYPDGLVNVNLLNENQFELREFNDNWTLRRIFLTGSFWALMISSSLSTLGIYIIIVHNVQFLVDQGFSKMEAALLFGLMGFISSIFRIFWGWVSDNMGREKTHSLGVFCITLGTGSLLLMGITGQKEPVHLFIIFFGIGWGVTAPLVMSVAADLFKGSMFGLIYGLVEASIGVGGAFGAWFGGFIFDKTGSYNWAFVLVIFVMAFSSAFIWLAAPRKVRPTPK